MNQRESDLNEKESLEQKEIYKNNHLNKVENELNILKGKLDFERKKLKEANEKHNKEKKSM